MKNKLLVFGYLISLFTTSSLIAQTFSTTTTTASGWTTATTVTHNIVVSGLPGNLTPGSLELLQVNLKMGYPAVAGPTSYNLDKYTFTLVAPDGTQFLLSGTNDFFNATTPSVFPKQINIKYRSANGVLRKPSWSVSNGATPREPWETGYYKARGWATDSTFNQRFAGKDPNGTWQIKISATSTAGISFNQCDLIFGPAFIVQDERLNNTYDNCEQPLCLEQGKVYLATNVGFKDASTSANASEAAKEPPVSTVPNLSGVGNCNWNGQQNNMAWFKFKATQTTAKITLSGVDLSLQIIGVVNAPNTSKCVKNNWRTLDGGCPMDPTNNTYQHNGVFNSIYNNGSLANMELNLRNLTVDSTYFIVVDGVGGNKSPFYLEMSNAAPCGCTLPKPTIIGANDICPGDSVTLTSSVAVNYQWLLNGNVINGATNQTLVVKAAGNYSVRIDDGAGCLATSDPITINLKDPAVSPALNDTVICQGSSVVIGGAATPNYTYSWSPATGLSNASISNPVASPTVNTTYTVQTTNTSSGCSSLDSVKVSFATPDSVKVDLSATDTAFCKGTNITFTANGTNGGSTPVYQWYLNDVVISGQSGATFSTTSLANGDEVKVVYTSTQSPACLVNNPAADSLLLTVFDLPLAQAGNDTAVCSSGSFTIGSANNPAYSYSWSPATDLDDATKSNPLVTNPSSNVTYTLTVTDGNMCSSQDQVSISVGGNNPVLVSIAPSTTTLCSSDSVLVVATPTNGGAAPTYTWYLNGVAIQSGVNSDSLLLKNLSNQDSVWVVMTSSLTNCIVGNPGTSDTVSFNVNPVTPVSVSIAANTTTVCALDSVLFVATPTNGGTSPTYEWRINGVPVNPANNNDTLIVPPGANSYTVSCVLTSSLTTCVTNNPATSNDVAITIETPTAVNAGADVTICLGSSVTLNATGGTSYTWVPATGLSSATVANPIASPTSSTAYTVTSGTGKCASSDTVWVRVDSGVVASFTASPLAGNAPLTVTMINGTQGATAYKWTYGDGSTVDTTVNTSHVYTNEGSYTVVLEASNANGCKDTASVVIVVEQKKNHFIPNVITPNGDNVNDVFSVTGEGIATLEVVIFNRWGMKLYEYTGVNGFWNGKVSNGQLAPDGTYYYIAKIKYVNTTSVITETGFFTLLR